MFDCEFLVACFMYVQPPFFGYIFFSISRSSVLSRFVFSKVGFIRRRFKSIKFFECAVYSRLVSSIQYDLYIITFCILFILYDVDLIFFFTEVTYFEGWSVFEFLIVCLNMFLLLSGLWYDYIRGGFMWAY